MAELSTIARPYAAALFSLAKASKESLDDWLARIKQLASVVEHPQVTAILGDPNISAAQLFDLVSALVKTPLAGEAANFLKLLVENQRLEALPEIGRQFQQLKNADEGVADCLIESAFPLNERDTDELVASLTRKFGIRLKAQVVVNPELIGGVRVAVGDQVLDNSVRAQLTQMRTALTA